MIVADLPCNVIAHVLQWADLSSHLRFREASTFYRDEIPRRTTTLVATGCVVAQRCHDEIFGADKTLLRSITVDLSPSSVSRSRTTDPAGGDATTGDTLQLLVREHRPAELRVNNMIAGGQLSGALLALEENLGQIRRHLSVLQLGLATCGPRPYQDPRSHAWCMLRLRLLLGGTQAPEGRVVARELADLTRALETVVCPLVGIGFADKVEREASAFGAGEALAGKAYWPRLTDLRLSCGVMGGDLEGLSACLGSNMPALSSLVLEGHSFRAPLTDLTAFANALRLTSEDPSHRPRLTTLCLKHFKVDGVIGLAALGKALSADRYPRLSTLAIDYCRLGDRQLQVLATALPGMSRTLKNLSLSGNYALSAEGISALARVLRIDHAPIADEGEQKSKSEQLEGGHCNPIEPSSVGDVGHGVGKARARSSRATAPAATIPIRAPAWSVPAMPSALPRAGTSEDPPSAPAPPVAPPLMIESLDLSYSCWWRRSRCRSFADKVAPPPLASFLRALGEGACPRLKKLSLAGCHFGDTVVERLVEALETGCQELRVLDITANLFGEAGILLIVDALFAGKMPPRLRLIVVCQHVSRLLLVLHSGMSRERVANTVRAWNAYQKKLQATFQGPHGPLVM